jgi:RNA polymerase-binding transcription factor DksA
VDPADVARLLEAVGAARARTEAQVAALERSVASIVEGAELTSTDDEHDPEGATIAYERAQASALLRQAAEDLGRLGDNAARLASGSAVVCDRCGAEIGTERLLALPTARACIRCAS